MAAITLCDRCGKVFKANKGMKASIMLEANDVWSSAAMKTYEYDLCERCAKDMLDEFETGSIILEARTSGTKL